METCSTPTSSQRSMTPTLEPTRSTGERTVTSRISSIRHQDPRGVLLQKTSSRDPQDTQRSWRTCRRTTFTRLRYKAHLLSCGRNHRPLNGLTGVLYILSPEGPALPTLVPTWRRRAPPAQATSCWSGPKVTYHTMRCLHPFQSRPSGLPTLPHPTHGMETA